ncbi:MAG: hypothetical protein KAX15_05090 [Candidatus Omnitrophica bacterium]|nr:hypothetical protein [Candidatus Omnitrophota bacterium]
MNSKDQNAFTYVECLLALVFLSIVLAPLLLAFPTGLHGTRLAKNITMANLLAEDLMDEIKSKRFDENTAEPFIGTLGYDGAEGSDLPSRIAFNDVDDYNNWPPTGITAPVDMEGLEIPEFTDFTREVVVEYVDYDDIDTWTVSSSIDTYYKIISIYVSGPYNPTIKLESIVSFH